MRVNLKFFKQNGESYDILGHYETKYTFIEDVWQEVYSMSKKGKLPGIYGVTNSIVLVDIPEHPNNELRLINVVSEGGISVGGSMNGNLILNGSGNTIYS